MNKTSFDDVPSVPKSGYTIDKLVSMMTTMGSFENKSEVLLSNVKNNQRGHGLMLLQK
ncbi:MAG: hypothetical protein ACLU4J_16065 [Butyricimonas paravirosa]